MKRWLWNLFNRGMRRPPVVKLLFTSATMRARDVDIAQCAICSNHFWFEDAQIEIPKFCPYCGIRFERTRWLSSNQFQAGMEGH
jgi:hypothetical protein